MSTEIIRLIREGEKGGKGVQRWGEREIIYLLLHCHHQNDSCIKMGSDESHFNVSIGSDGHSHKTVSTNHNLFEEKVELVQSNWGPSTYQPNAIPLGQTISEIYIYIKLWICLQNLNLILIRQKCASQASNISIFNCNHCIDPAKRLSPKLVFTSGKPKI